MRNLPTVANRPPVPRYGDSRFHKNANASVGSGGGIGKSVLVQLLGDFIATSVRVPVSRVFLLQCARGELVRCGRIPPNGLEGVEECVQHIIKKEGVFGLFRGGWENELLDAATKLLRITTASVIAQFHLLMAHFFGRGAVLFHFCEPFLQLLITLPMVGLRDAVLYNYTVDIVAPKNSEEQKNPFVEEAYIYNSAWEAVSAVLDRYGWEGLCFNGLDADFLELGAQLISTKLVASLTMSQVNYLAKADGASILRKVAVVTAVDVALRVFLITVQQPFQVLRARVKALRPRDDPTASRSWSLRGVADIVHAEGFKGLWTGLRVRLLGEVGAVLIRSLYYFL
uniref:WGS project CAEQ00000000 data, annotated contig 1888 n=1 Tax=Trypanosoma congolense (strain IL3000) TaxID=1068625 RepID=F9W9R5_TRYCI|nr:unnamed protein product [Trypanosoma congolense IL3000]